MSTKKMHGTYSMSTHGVQRNLCDACVQYQKFAHVNCEVDGTAANVCKSLIL